MGIYYKTIYIKEELKIIEDTNGADIYLEPEKLTSLFMNYTPKESEKIRK